MQGYQESAGSSIFNLPFEQRHVGRWRLSDKIERTGAIAPKASAPQRRVMSASLGVWPAGRPHARLVHIAAARPWLRGLNDACIAADSLPTFLVKGRRDV